MGTLKRIGLIGGMSWESTQLYYRIINQRVASQLGGLRSAPILLDSLDFHEVVERQQAGRWDDLAEMLSQSAVQLQAAGADCVLICTNTMHRVAGPVAARLRVPLLHIADTAAAAVKATGRTRVAVLGTRYTMEQDFYRDHLRRHGLDSFVPRSEHRDEVHRIIFEELCRGQVLERSRSNLQDICAHLETQGAQAVLLACTELCLLLRPQDIGLPLLDTTELHASAAAEFAMGPAASATAIESCTPDAR